MSSMLKWVPILLTSLSLYALDEEFIVNLKDPEYQDGVIKTSKGGVIRSTNIRIQAESITYTNKEDSHKVVAEGNLLIDNGERIFIGDKLEYDFISGTGVLYKGKTFVDVWFLGGEKLTINKDKTFTIENAYVTTSEGSHYDWALHTGEVSITDKHYLTAKNVTFQFMETPIFYLPSFKSNLKIFTDSPIKYKLDWDKGQGPRISMRYRVYSWKRSSIFVRFDYRLRRGFGVALESESRSKDKRTTFLTKNYFAHDTFYNDDNPNQEKKRYRLQGHLTSSSPDGKTKGKVVWDKFSDRNMPGDFKTDDFVLSTAKRTEVNFSKISNHFLFATHIRPKINSFQGFKQEIPAVQLFIHPLVLGKTGVLFENKFNISYLDYASADDVEQFIPDFHAFRIESNQSLLRPIPIKGATLTPSLGFTGIGYNNSPDQNPAFQAMLNYGLDLQITGKKTFKTFQHTFTPYIHFKGLTSPTTKIDHVYIFGLNDGLNKIDLLKTGIEQTFTFLKYNTFEPTLLTELYTYSFFDENIYKTFIPKFGGTFTLNLPRVVLESKIGWNSEERLLDFANASLKWTLNENFAMGVEFRHRGRFYWKKDDHDNYILDVSRPISELLVSPLSDNRNTFLTKLQLQIAPEWVLRLQMHQGWGRKGEPFYNEAKVDLITMLTSTWRLKLSYMHTVRDDQVSFRIFLVK